MPMLHLQAAAETSPGGTRAQLFLCTGMRLQAGFENQQEVGGVVVNTHIALGRHLKKRSGGRETPLFNSEIAEEETLQVQNLLHLNDQKCFPTANGFSNKRTKLELMEVREK